MPNVTQPPDSDEPPGPRVTPYFTAALEAEAARRGLPPEPRAA
jgi:hypothetical protein